MKTLVIGGGGREHALAWKLAQSPRVEIVYVAPGNAGTAAEPGVENVDIAAQDIESLRDFAQAQQIGLTVVGPEAPLVAGVVDTFEETGLPCFGPRAEAARLEGSKAFTKDFLARHRIPTAAHEVFEEVEAASEHVHRHGAPIVVKADGLAAGKGVTVATTVDEAVAAVRACLGGKFGDAGARVVIEECLVGEEVSFICMVDGLQILPLATSQDHKARDDGDTGPNTGGMGAYSPAPLVSEALHDRILKEVIEPTVQGLVQDGTPYRGFLYAGLMIGEDGVPRVLEYNCRFGDPETQPILFRLRSDLVSLCEAALSGRLDSATAEWDPRPALGVVMAAGGYPEAYRRGEAIHGLEQAAGDHVKVFHAGTRLRDGEVVTDGGRVLCVTACGHDIGAARQRAYEHVDRISWPGAFYRSDIGYRAVARASR